MLLLRHHATDAAVHCQQETEACDLTVGVNTGDSIAICRCRTVSKSVEIVKLLRGEYASTGPAHMKREH